MSFSHIRPQILRKYWHIKYQHIQKYGKCPKISKTKVSDKMPYVNSADPDQTDPEGVV